MAGRAAAETGYDGGYWIEGTKGDGVYKTSDGGLTWTKVLDGGAEAGATELVMEPGTNQVLYAAI